MRNCQTVFHGVCATSQPRQQCTRGPTSPRPRQRSFSVLLLLSYSSLINECDTTQRAPVLISASPLKEGGLERPLTCPRSHGQRVVELGLSLAQGCPPLPGVLSSPILAKPCCPAGQRPAWCLQYPLGSVRTQAVTPPLPGEQEEEPQPPASLRPRRPRNYGVSKGLTLRGQQSCWPGGLSGQGVPLGQPGCSKEWGPGREWDARLAPPDGPVAPCIILPESGGSEGGSGEPGQGRREDSRIRWGLAGRLERRERGVGPRGRARPSSKVTPSGSRGLCGAGALPARTPLLRGSIPPA